MTEYLESYEHYDVRHEDVEISITLGIIEMSNISYVSAMAQFTSLVANVAGASYPSIKFNIPINKFL